MIKAKEIWGRRETQTGFWLEKMQERDHLEDLGVDGRIILRRIFWKWDLGAWGGSSWFKIRKVGGNFECGNEPLGSIKCGEFLD